MPVRLKLWCEMLVLFAVLPLAVCAMLYDMSTWLMPLLCAVGGVCLVVLLSDHNFQRIRLHNVQAFQSSFTQVLKMFVPGASVIALAIYWFWPEYFLALPTQNPSLWLATLLVYPVISVIPQEIIFRTYFFHRYKHILPSKRKRWALSSFFFGAAHVVYGNWIAVILSGFGGLLFGYRYMKSRSTLAVVFEHTLWGSFLFTVGMGSFFLSKA